MLKSFIPLLCGALAAVPFLACNRQSPVDLVVYNAVVYTVDSAFSTQEAFAVKDGQFVEVGSTASIRAKYAPAEEIDAQGLPVYPGFYDPHAHFFGYALTLGQADLAGARSFEEVI